MIRERERRKREGEEEREKERERENVPLASLLDIPSVSLNLDLSGFLLLDAIFARV